MLKRIVVIAMIASMTAISFCGVVNAKEINYQTTESLEYRECYFYIMSGLSFGDEIDIKVKVTDGGNVDVLLMDSIDHNHFRTIFDNESGDIDCYIKEMHTKSVAILIDAPKDGDYYIVVDNSFVPDDGAQPTGPVNFTIDIKTNGGLSDTVCCAPLVMILGILLLSVAAVCLVRLRKV